MTRDSIRSDSAARRREWAPTLGLVGFFILLAMFEALGSLARLIRTHHPITADSLLEGTPSWFVHLPLLWGVRVLTLRLPLTRENLWRRLPVYFVTGLAFNLLVVMGTAPIARAMGYAQGPLLSIIGRSFFAFLPYELAIYGVIVGVFHTYDYGRAVEEHARARAELAASLSQARLQALRSQLSPHFFFNTLNAISTFSLQGRPEQVVEMVGGLGDLVRATLDDELPHEVPLSRELALLELYIQIQRVRFADWLRIDMAIDPCTRDVLVPSLVLQPLVENAIEHGGADLDGVHRVLVRSARVDGWLDLSVENPGIDEESLPATPTRTGLGLRNTAERLRQLHPEQHQFEYGMVPGRGFVTRIRLPLRTAALAPEVTA